MSHKLSIRRGTSLAAAPRATAPLRLADRPTFRATFAALITLAALMWIAPPAAADECAITDLECIHEQLEETVDAVGGAAGDAADTVTDTADDAVESVQGVVDDTAARAKEILDGILGRGDTDPGDDKGKDAGKAGGGSSGAGDRNGLGRGLSGPRDPSLAPSGSGAVGDGLDRTPEASGGLGRGIVNGVRDLAFPLTLVALVLGFLALQNRLDRRDPKLAAAPLGPDFLTFD